MYAVSIPNEEYVLVEYKKHKMYEYILRFFLFEVRI